MPLFRCGGARRINPSSDDVRSRCRRRRLTRNGCGDEVPGVEPTDPTGDGLDRSAAPRWPRAVRRTPHGLLVIALVSTLAATGCATTSRAADPTPAVPPDAASTAPGAPEASGGALALPTTGSSSRTVAEIARLTELVSADPGNEDAHRDLGFAVAQRVRETADPSLYAPALAAFDAALALEPEDALALVGVAGIELGKHEFEKALQTAGRAIELSPSLVAAHAARLDALVELGRYDDAQRAAGELLGLGIDQTTLARVSYIDELQGRLPEAVAAMRRATTEPAPARENSAYVSALLGNLLVYDGDIAGAETAYDAALNLVPEHAPSLAGQGRLAVGAGRLDDAIALFRNAAAVVPLPEYVLALGDAQAASGDDAAAKQSYDLARAEIQLFEAAGVVVDVDLAIFEADHGDPEAAIRHATAAYAATPTVRAADAMAWALHRLGRDAEAAGYSAKALRLGSIDPILRYHAGAIEAALGNADAARSDLQQALDLDPGFSAVGAAEARRLLGTLP
jgi:tetratricopeptide (TPR) repeat protein